MATKFFKTQKKGDIKMKKKAWLQKFFKKTRFFMFLATKFIKTQKKGDIQNFKKSQKWLQKSLFSNFQKACSQWLQYCSQSKALIINEQNFEFF